MKAITNLLDREQRLYIRNALAAWLVVFFLYAGFWWAIPLTYGQVMVLYAIGAFLYARFYLGE